MANRVKVTMGYRRRWQLYKSQSRNIKMSFSVELCVCARALYYSPTSYFYIKPFLNISYVQCRLFWGKMKINRFLFLFLCARFVCICICIWAVCYNNEKGENGSNFDIGRFYNSKLVASIFMYSDHHHQNHIQQQQKQSWYCIVYLADTKRIQIHIIYTPQTQREKSANEYSRWASTHTQALKKTEPRKWDRMRNRLHKKPVKMVRSNEETEAASDLFARSLYSLFILLFISAPSLLYSMSNQRYTCNGVRNRPFVNYRHQIYAIIWRIRCLTKSHHKWHQRQQQVPTMNNHFNEWLDADGSPAQQKPRLQ